MKARVKFTKQGNLKFIGHLDMMRYFQKAIKRSQLPIAYTNGFNPHQIMSFGAPLGLGMTSSAEYMDIELNDKIKSKAAIDALSATMVDGIKILSFKYLPEKTPNAMSATSAAYYKVNLHDNIYNAYDNDSINRLIYKFRLQDEYIYNKTTKHSIKQINIIPLIYDFSYTNDSFYIKCSSGSNDNIKPEIIIESLMRYFNIISSDDVLDRNCMSIERLELYTGDKDNLISLDQIGYEY